jgi:hypothetical protein
LLLIGVLVVALGAGGAVAFGLNQLRPVYFTRRSVTRASGIPVLGSVSLITSPQQRVAHRRRLVAWIGTNLALLVMCGVVIVYHGPIRHLLASALGGT